MTTTLGWGLLADPLLRSGLVYPLPLLLAGWLVLHRLPPKRRPTLTLPFALYALAAAGVLVVLVAKHLGLAPLPLVRELAILLVGVACIRIAGQVLFRAALPAAGARPPRLAEDLAVTAGYVAWALLRLSHNGLEPGSIVATSAVITAIIAFSLQETLANVFGGAALQLEDSIHLDDWIKVDDVVGRVVDIGWHSTLVETRNWETVVIPNAVLLRAKFTILGRRSGAPRQWRRWIRFTVGYNEPPQRVIATAESALRRARITGVATEPAPNCVAMDFGDSSISYAVRYWLTDLAADDPTDSDVRCHVHAAMARAGIAFAYPVTTMLVEENERLTARARSHELAERLHALRGIALFSSFRDTELEQVALHMVPAPFLAGETITRQGDVAHWLYVLVSGEAEVAFERESGERRVLGTIRAGTQDSFFGEIGMLTGAPRSSSVVALSDVQCLRLDKEGFELVLRQRPAIAEEISAIMARRRVGLAATQDALDEEARRRQMADDHGELLDRIRRFFGLDHGAPAPLERTG